MRLAKGTVVKERLTYRNLMLGFGIGVALIVILTLWASRKGSALALTTHVTTILSYVEMPDITGLVRKATKIDI